MADLVTQLSPKIKRRWFRFSLRTLFLMLTALGVWLGIQVHWIRQRHEFLTNPEIGWNTKAGSATVAPSLLWLLGEDGIDVIDVPDAANEVEAIRLFPEANVWSTVGGPGIIAPFESIPDLIVGDDYVEDGSTAESDDDSADDELSDSP